MSHESASALNPHVGEGYQGTRRSPRRILRLLYLLIALVVIAGLLLAGWLPRRRRTAEVDARAAAQKSALPVVQVMTIHQASATEQLTLPGTVTPMTVAHIYARAAGYLKKRYVDLGDKVHRGR